MNGKALSPRGCRGSGGTGAAAAQGRAHMQQGLQLVPSPPTPPTHSRSSLQPSPVMGCAAVAGEHLRRGELAESKSGTIKVNLRLYLCAACLHACRA